MKLEFTKMHGAGNDFVMVDATRTPVDLAPAQLRRIADRHLGIGCDQILVVEAPRRADTDFYYRIFNADGGEVEQCGNGARCFVRFVHDHGLTAKREIRVETLGGIIQPRLEDDGRVSVDMGAPEFEPAHIPFQAPLRADVYRLDLADGAIEISAVSMGNPHAVQVIADVDQAPVVTQGAQIESHPRFPNRVNAGFMQLVDRRRIRLRVFERGSGETLACGSGACAAVVIGIVRGMLDTTVDVQTRGGVLTISWPAADAPVVMTGPAEHVFAGTIEL